MILERQSSRTFTDGPVPGMRVATVWDDNGDGSYFVQFVEGTRFPMHNHDGWEQILMLTGTIKFGEITLTPGDTLMLKHGDVHGALALTDASFFVAHRGDIAMVAD